MKHLLFIISVASFGSLFSQLHFQVCENGGFPVSNVEIFSHGKSIGKTNISGMIIFQKPHKGDTLSFVSDKYFPQQYIVTKKRSRELQHINLVRDASKEDHAYFPGGRLAMNQWVAANMQYPDKEYGIGGKCWIRFKVGTDGSISDVKIVKPVYGCPECDQEALRLFSIMPKWIPKQQNGKAVESHYEIQLTFGYN